MAFLTLNSRLAKLHHDTGVSFHTKPTDIRDIPNPTLSELGGTQYHGWLRHYATSLKVMGSILNEVNGSFT
jgi:hypothetical protein